MLACSVHPNNREWAYKYKNYLSVSVGIQYHYRRAEGEFGNRYVYRQERIGNSYLLDTNQMKDTLDIIVSVSQIYGSHW